MGMKMNIEECAEMLAERLPDGRRLYADHIKMYGEVLLHVLVGDMIDRPLVELLKSNENPDIIKIYCAVIEEMWLKGDDNVVNVVEAMNIPDDNENCARGIIAMYARNETIPAPLKAFAKALKPVRNIPLVYIRCFFV